MRKTAVLAALLFVLIASILIFSQRKNTLLKIAKTNFPGQPIIMFVLDSRNTQSINFIANFFEYLDRNCLLINVGTIFINSKVVPFNGRYQVYEKKKIRGFGDSQDAFLFFSSEGKLLLQGTLSNIPDSLLHTINPQYALDHQHIFDDLHQIADTTEEISFFSDMKEHLCADFTCFLFFDQVCLCNNSVNTILKIMKIEEHSSEVRHFVIPMFDYSQEEISLIKNNNGFVVDFILPSVEDLKKWKVINKDPLHKHPLDELIILADNHGTILLFSNKWENYMAWREEHLAKRY